MAVGERRVDINADVGELDGAGADGDAALLESVSSCSIACGGHAGDAATMQGAVRAARRHGVALGAHPSYPDRDGFGRRALAIAAADLTHSLRGQIGALAAVAAAEGVALRHVKPHGALYARAAADPVVADLVAAAVRDVDPRLVLVGPTAGALVAAGRRAGLETATEAFADRGYEADGTLTPRDRAGALLTDPPLVARRVLRMVTAGVVTAADGRDLAVHADTICIHGDTPGAVEIARMVRAALVTAGIRIEPFSSCR